nr:MAG TPA: hypothetical protein [Caudoviricetes sp.]
MSNKVLDKRFTKFFSLPSIEVLLFCWSNLTAAPYIMSLKSLLVINSAINSFSLERP